MVKCDNKRVLVLSLYSGENDWPKCIKALKEQTYTNWEHEVISNMPNVEAHQVLYEKIMASADEFDLFLKVDADMVFKSRDVLSEIIKCFKREPDMDHAVFSVKDWYSQIDIMGMHAYTGNVNWSTSKEELFVDPNPEFEGCRKLFWNAPAPVADHSPDPSLEEAFLFGMHRALKIVQRDRWKKNTNQARIQLNLLTNVWQEFLKSDDLRRGAVIYGAECAFSGKVKIIEDKSNGLNQEKVIKRIYELKTRGIQNKFVSRWRSGSTRTFLRKWRRITLPELANNVIRQVVKVKKI